MQCVAKLLTMMYIDSYCGFVRSLDVNIKGTYFMKKEHRITVSLDSADHAALSDLAERCGVSASWIVRRALADFLEQHKGQDVQLPFKF